MSRGKSETYEAICKIKKINCKMGVDNCGRKEYNAVRKAKTSFG